MISELSIHVPEGETPELSFTKFDSRPPVFTTIKLCLADCPTITFFINKPEDIVAFKNNLLWAFEKYIKE